MRLSQVRRDGAPRAAAAARPAPSTGLIVAGAALLALLLLWLGIVVQAAVDIAPMQQRAPALWTAVEIAALAALAGVLATLFLGDIRGRRDAPSGSRDGERQDRDRVAGAFDMIVCFDPHTQRRTYVSPACRRIYGYDAEEALSLGAEQIVHPDDYPVVVAALQRLKAEPGQPPIQYRGRRKDGSYVWVEASLALSKDPATGADEIVAIVRDVGERISYEAALRRAKEEADIANRSKSQFLATMSHELRTPLNAIIGFAEIMENQVMGPIGNEHYRSYISDIHLSGSHLLQLINDILDLTKAEAGMLELNEDLVDVAAAIGAVARVTGAPIEKAGLSLILDLPPALPPLRADERKVRQVFFNLIGNSVKFTPAGGEIRVYGELDPAGLRITVADTGIGIAAEDIDRVVQPFVQVDSSFARQHHGTGLGLPAVKAIMELHGGRIELRSTL
ncbi:MAG TPA: PAS domain-containing sensor histidine kinase, partial [Stellaceae bacterium]|nr:PAS domain-containing sensor histidine kinase [Stellaceae bacterium]